MVEKIVIIGAGPAGISAALYAARANMEPLVINNGIGALKNAEKIENYYGFEDGIDGKELYFSGIKQTEKIETDVKKVEIEQTED